jgi:hypothetical protein
MSKRQLKTLNDRTQTTGFGRQNKMLRLMRNGMEGIRQWEARKQSRARDALLLLIWLRDQRRWICHDLTTIQLTGRTSARRVVLIFTFVRAYDTTWKGPGCDFFKYPIPYFLCAWSLDLGAWDITGSGEFGFTSIYTYITMRAM